jgi:hypothetical protein
MLSLEEALLLKAAQEEAEKQQSIQAASIVGGAGGALLGRIGGSVPHQIGRGINALTNRSVNRLKPGFRLAGGLTGAILGGALGAGTAALMKQNNRPAQLLGDIQAKGSISPAEEQELAKLLGELYTDQARGM